MDTTKSVVKQRVATSSTKKRAIVSHRAPGSTPKPKVAKLAQAKPQVNTVARVTPQVNMVAQVSPQVSTVTQVNTVVQVKSEKPKTVRSGSGCNSCAARRMARQTAEAAKKAQVNPK